VIKTLLQASLFVSMLLAVSLAGTKIYPTSTIAELCAPKDTGAEVSAAPAVAVAPEEDVAPAPVVAATAPSADDAASTAAARIERGAYIVNSFGCQDCHTPLKLGPNGPEPDATRMFSGHPEGLVMPPAPKLPAGPWAVVVAATNTAWAGPWGTSFTANLTPDRETGIGSWTEQDFLDTVRSARHQGRGRPILPPMPIQMLNNMTDEDLLSIYAYLRTVPAVKNKVPQPLAPEASR
jgi:mono/diheme cytochrome c family protein